MQITGSVRRLLLGITAFGILVALIRNFPDSSLEFALIVARFVPSLASCAFFTYVCQDRRRALLITAGGAFLGWLLSPTVWANYEYQNWYDDYFHYYQYWPVNSGIGALFAGLAEYVVEFAASRIIRK